MQHINTSTKGYTPANIVKEDEIEPFLENGKDFINEDDIWKRLEENRNPDSARIRDIISKAYELESLHPDDTAALLHVESPELWKEIFEAAGEIKHKVYDNRIVTFAPLYCSNYCVNNCLYCGFRAENRDAERRQLSLDEVKNETAALAGRFGHKRLIVVYGEHPACDVDYIVNSLESIYSVKVKTRRGEAGIRRANVNAPPLSTAELKQIHEAGIGTYQVFQETYHHDTYNKVHPPGTIKNHYAWRLYCHHRAMQAGIDDWGIGALFGLFDWRFEVMGLLYHSRELEKQFGIGPHTISFPRLEPAANTPHPSESKYKVSDEDFKKLIAVIRLSVPYTGMILTAREPAYIRRDVMPLGITQTDASTRIGIGAYSDRYNEQESDRQQFMLGDTRSLDELAGELADQGTIISFCTAGYRCGRTGTHIMKLLKDGTEGNFCKANAVLTYREWLDDFASEETKAKGEKVIRKELEEIKNQNPELYELVKPRYEQISKGQRDLYV